AREHNYSFYDIRAHHGLLRTLQLRICRSGEIMANLVFGQYDKPAIDTLMTYIARSFPEITTLLYTVNTKKNDSLHDLSPVVYTGQGFVTETLEELRFKIGPKSFFQTNTWQAEQLYRITRDFAGL